MGCPPQARERIPAAVFAAAERESNSQTPSGRHAEEDNSAGEEEVTVETVLILT